MNAHLTPIAIDVPDHRAGRTVTHTAALLSQSAPMPYSRQDFIDASEEREPAVASHAQIAEAFATECGLLGELHDAYTTQQRSALADFVTSVNERAQALADEAVEAPRKPTPNGKWVGLGVDAIELLQGLRTRDTIGADDVARIDALLKRAGVWS